MFIKSVVVKNYQSLYSVGINLGRFTVIFGESDVGKSAFYRAFRALLTAESGDSFISDGTTKAGVAVRLGSDDVIVWSKKKGKSANYKLNDKLWQKNKSLPEEIREKLQINVTVVDGEKFYPNLRGQFDNLFLLFDSSSKRARILGSLISNILLDGIKQANLRRNRNEADVRAMSSMIEGFEKKKKIDWSGLLSPLREQKKEVGKLGKADKKLHEAEELKERWRGLAYLQKIKIEPLPKDLFVEVGKLLEKFDVAFGWYKHLVSADHVEFKCIEDRNDWLLRLSDVRKELQEVKKKLKIKCPRCKQEFSILEIAK